MAASGGLLKASGLVFAHRGEVIVPDGGLQDAMQRIGLKTAMASGMRAVFDKLLSRESAPAAPAAAATESNAIAPVATVKDVSDGSGADGRAPVNIYITNNFSGINDENAVKQWFKDNAGGLTEDVIRQIKVRGGTLVSV